VSNNFSKKETYCVTVLTLKQIIQLTTYNKQSPHNKQTYRVERVDDQKNTKWDQCCREFRPWLSPWLCLKQDT